jgi:5-methylthioadenosine/S-adenosylhomocysteine deaminase
MNILLFLLCRFLLFLRPILRWSPGECAARAIILTDNRGNTLPACRFDMTKVDLVIEPRWLIPVEPDGTAYRDHSIAIAQGVIAEILPQADARRRYPDAEFVTLPTHALIPGLINAHTHAAMSLFRGLADDLPLMTWLNDHIWPAEQRWVAPEFVADGTRLAVAEMIRGGTTCFNDMYFFAEDTARIAHDAGMRASVGMIVLDFPSAYAANWNEYVDKGLRLHDDWRTSGLVTTAFAPHAPYTVSDEPLKKISTLNNELNCPVHIHVHETAFEVSDAVEKTGTRPLARLDGLDLVNPNLLAVHFTQASDEDIALMAERNANVVHCPESNLKLASGFAPVARFVAAGVNVALGTDGAASNNDLDMLGEMRTAALLAKGVSGDATALPAHGVLRMATLNGARALGIDTRTGSLVAGKAADITAIDLADLATEPVYDPVSQIVYAAGRHQVTDVWVAGQRLLSGGLLTTLDETRIREKAQAWRDKIAASDRH